MKDFEGYSDQHDVLLCIKYVFNILRFIENQQIIVFCPCTNNLNKTCVKCFNFFPQIGCWHLL